MVVTLERARFYKPDPKLPKTIRVR